MVSPWMEHGTVINYLKEHGHGNVDKLVSFRSINYRRCVLTRYFSYTKLLKAFNIYTHAASFTET